MVVKELLGRWPCRDNIAIYSAMMTVNFFKSESSVNYLHALFIYFLIINHNIYDLMPIIF